MESRIGHENYVNRNCWLAQTLGYPPAKRCWYCELRFRVCPFGQYLLVSLVLAAVAFGLIYLEQRKINRTDVVAVFVLILAYGYFTTQSTERIIETSFAERQSRMALEESKASLEAKVGERTEELKKLTDTLGKQVKERTRELEEKVEELERINRLAVGREIRMVELKEKIKKLEEEPPEREK